MSGHGYFGAIRSASREYGKKPTSDACDPPRQTATNLHTPGAGWFVVARTGLWSRASQIVTAGGAEGDRTPDLVIANDALSHLSYGPVPAFVPTGANSPDTGHSRLTERRAHSVGPALLPSAKLAGNQHVRSVGVRACQGMNSLFVGRTGGRARGRIGSRAILRTAQKIGHA